MFQAICITNSASGSSADFVQLDEAELPRADVLVEVEFSSINYKDALAITGKSPVVRKFPMVPGIDLVGTVRQSHSDRFKHGDRVLLNGWGLGETWWGGLSELASVKAEWLLHLPERISAIHAAAIGTAGYTAMLCVNVLRKHGIRPNHGEIIVTGAAGGVGSVAVSLLHNLGYRVAACTGRPEESDYLKAMGASVIVDRAEYAQPGRPLGKERWAGAVDCVGSHTLANICATLRYGGAVAACGLAQGMDLPASVAPFILRGVSLIGVDSVYHPMAGREAAWQDLGQHLDQSKLDKIYREIRMDDVIPVAGEVLAGRTRGRLVVRV